MNLKKGPISDKIIFIILIFIFSSINCFAQTQSDSVTARKYRTKAELLRQQARYDSSAHYYEKASGLYGKSENWRMQAHCQNKLFEVFFSMAMYERAAVAAHLAWDIAS